jgi:hypothetical protein
MVMALINTAAIVIMVACAYTGTIKTEAGFAIPLVGFVLSLVVMWLMDTVQINRLNQPKPSRCSKHATR